MDTRTWKCPDCGHRAEVSYADLLEIGTPMCCDKEMDLLADRPARIIVQVRDGRVESVHASRRGMRVTVLDWDAVHDTPPDSAERRAAGKVRRQIARMREVY